MNTLKTTIGTKLLLAGLLLLALPALVWLLLLDLRPVVEHPGPLTEDRRLKVEQIIVDNSPPRFQRSGHSNIELSAADLDLLAAMALESIPGLHSVAARFDLTGPDIVLQLTRPITTGPLTWYLNVRADLGINNNRVLVRDLKAGQLPIPGPVQQLLLRHADSSLRRHSIDYHELLELQQNIHSLALNGSRLNAELHWQPTVITELRTQAQQMFVSAQDRERLIRYYRAIREISTAQAPVSRSSSVHDFLQMLFAHAAQRTERGHDPVSENRSLLQALTLYVNNLELATLVADVPTDLLAEHRNHTLTLAGRTDLTRHFVTSAAITASTGAAIAEVLANSKELHDARYSTGFSFSDVTANTAGVMFGQVATADAEAARHLQQRMSTAADEHAYMPAVDRSEDGLSETEFTARYGNRESEGYRQRINLIEQQISALPLYDTPD